MSGRFGWAALIFLCVSASTLLAQAQSEPWPRANPTGAAAAANQPDQPVNPQLPTIERRTAPISGGQFQAQPQGANQALVQPLNQPLAQAGQTQENPQQAAPPFVLTQQEEDQLNRVLGLWEQKGKEIKNFDSNFVRWDYDPVFAKPNTNPNAPIHTDQGVLKYQAPDKVLFRTLNTQDAQNKWTPIEEDRAEHWVCDGKSVSQYIPKQKQLVEHKLPPELQGMALADGPMPFLFSTDAKKIRQRYFVHLVTPPDRQNEIWIEAFPRYQSDAANFRRARLVLSSPEMTPKMMEIYQPNGKNHSSYEFYDIVINTNDLLRFLQGDPFQAGTPRGWQKIVEDAAATQAGRPANEAR